MSLSFSENVFISTLLPPKETFILEGPRGYVSLAIESENLRLTLRADGLPEKQLHSIYLFNPQNEETLYIADLPQSGSIGHLQLILNLANYCLDSSFQGLELHIVPMAEPQNEVHTDCKAVLTGVLEKYDGNIKNNSTLSPISMNFEKGLVKEGESSMLNSSHPIRFSERVKILQVNLGEFAQESTVVNSLLVTGEVVHVEETETTYCVSGTIKVTVSYSLTTSISNEHRIWINDIEADDDSALVSLSSSADNTSSYDVTVEAPFQINWPQKYSSTANIQVKILHYKLTQTKSNMLVDLVATLAPSEKEMADKSQYDKKMIALHGEDLAPIGNVIAYGWWLDGEADIPCQLVGQLIHEVDGSPLLLSQSVYPERCPVGSLLSEPLLEINGQQWSLTGQLYSPFELKEVEPMESKEPREQNEQLNYSAQYSDFTEELGLQQAELSEETGEIYTSKSMDIDIEQTESHNSEVAEGPEISMSAYAYTHEEHQEMQEAENSAENSAKEDTYSFSSNAECQVNREFEDQKEIDSTVEVYSTDEEDSMVEQSTESELPSEEQPYSEQPIEEQSFDEHQVNERSFDEQQVSEQSFDEQQVNPYPDIVEKTRDFTAGSYVPKVMLTGVNSITTKPGKTKTPSSKFNSVSKSIRSGRPLAKQAEYKNIVNKDIEQIVAADPSSQINRRQSSWKMTTVNPGDSLESIAKRYQVSVQDICLWNKINSEQELSGTTLIILTNAK